MKTKKDKKAGDVFKEAEVRFEKLGGEIKDAGRKVWLAGLGAVSEADEQGRSLFDELVAKGRQVQDARKKRLDEVFGGSSRRARRVAEWWTGTLQETFDGITRRTTETLQRLGVPTYEDIRLLNRRVAELNEKVTSLGGRQGL